MLYIVSIIIVVKAPIYLYMISVLMKALPTSVSATASWVEEAVVLALSFDASFLSVQSLCKEVDSGTSGLEDPHRST